MVLQSWEVFHVRTQGKVITQSTLEKICKIQGKRKVRAIEIRDNWLAIQNLTMLLGFTEDVF
jgi:hypothetical protein